MAGLLDRVRRYGALRAGAARSFARNDVDEATVIADMGDRQLAEVEQLMNEIIADHEAYYHLGVKCAEGSDGRCADRAGTRQPMPLDLVHRLQSTMAWLAGFDMDGRRDADELDAIWQQAQCVMRRVEEWYENNPEVDDV
jgi:hypothetical protein